MKTMNPRQTDPTSGDGAAPPDPEVIEKPKRRQFTAEYKRRIVNEANACMKPGEIGALLRREGLYSSVLSQWRRQAGKAKWPLWFEHPTGLASFSSRRGPSRGVATGSSFAAPTTSRPPR